MKKHNYIVKSFAVLLCFAMIVVSAVNEGIPSIFDGFFMKANAATQLNVTQDEAVDWAIKNYEKVTGAYNTDDYKGQCVSFVKNYVCYGLKIEGKIYFPGNAAGAVNATFLANGETIFKDSDRFEIKDENASPEPGDIFVWNYYYSRNDQVWTLEYGHVGVIVDVNYDTRIYTAVNWNGWNGDMHGVKEQTPYKAGIITAHFGDYTSLIRPKFKPKTFLFDVNVNINGQPFDAGYDGLTYDVHINNQLVKDDQPDYCDPECPVGTSYAISDFKYKGKRIKLLSFPIVGSTPKDGNTIITLNFTWTLDVNVFFPKGNSGTTYENGIKNFTYDLYINGIKVRDDTEDYCEMVMPGSTFLIDDVKLNGWIPFYFEPKSFGDLFNPSLYTITGKIDHRSTKALICVSESSQGLFGDDPIPAHAPVRKNSAKNENSSRSLTAKRIDTNVNLFASVKHLTSVSSTGVTYAGNTGRSSYVRPLQYIEPSIPCYLSTAMAGTRSDNVAWIQREIKKLGYNDMPVDGYYGNTTANVVKRFQKDYDLPVTGCIATNDLAVIKRPVKNVKAPELKLTTPSVIPSGGIATVSWASVEHAEDYNVYVYNSAGKLVDSAVNTKATTASFVLYNAGEYTIKAISENERFTSSQSAIYAKVTVVNPGHVQFVDWDGTVLSNQFVERGKAARTPASPERDGYTFIKWDKDYSSITAAETVVRAVYTRNQYKVRFLNTDGKEIYTDVCYFGESAEAPDASQIKLRSGYAFVGWDKDFSNVFEDITVRPITEWINTDIPVIIDSCKAVKDGSYGYNVTVDVRNYDKGRTNGRVVVALKTSSGKFITMTESSAFTLDSSGESSMDVFVPCSVSASYVDVFVVDAYNNLIPISETVRRQTSQSNTSSGTTRTISGRLDSSLAGKQAILFIYKIDEASDYTNEFIGQTVIGSNGSYSFTYQLREEPSAVTGDYTVVLGVEGADNVINLGTIRAPKAVHTVRIVDFDGRVISTQQVEDGDNAVLPTENPERTGYTFAGWDYTNTAIHEDLTITPIYVHKVYTVVFIDWTNERYDMQNYYYGEPLIAPDLTYADEYETIGWDGFTEGMTVTGNMVLTATYEKKSYTVKFYDENGKPIHEETVDYGKTPMHPTCESEDKLFAGWSSYDFEFVTNNLEVYPVFLSYESAEEPSASLEEKIYTQDIELALTADEGSVIYYSVNGGDYLTYSQPFTLTETSEIRAYSSADGKEDSNKVTFTYIINKAGDESNWKFPVYVYSDALEPETLLVDVAESLTVGELKEKLANETIEGLYKDENFAEEYDDSFVLTDGCAVYVRYAGSTHTVTFKDVDGSVIETQTVKHLSHASVPEMPETRNGLVFAGWDSYEYALVRSDIVITAVYKDEYLIDSVKLGRRSYTMMEGFDHTLSVEFTGENAYEILWTSSDESVAAVDETGRVIALKEGSATITATILGTEVSDQCVITVEKNPDLSLTLTKGSQLSIKDGMVIGISPTVNTVGEIKACFDSTRIALRSELSGSDMPDNIRVGTGNVIVLYDENGSVIKTAVLVINGDVDGNGLVNNVDVSRVLRAVVNDIPFDHPYSEAADVNGDGAVNNRDASMLSRYLVGKETL